MEWCREFLIGEAIWTGILVGWFPFFLLVSKNVKNFCAFANVVCQSCILEEMVIRKLERKAR